MKHAIRVFCVILLAALPCSSEAALFGSMESWDFMQRVGGIMIGSPHFEKGNWYLPVNCDVSGLTKITIKPTLLNSGLAWADTVVKVRGNEVDLTIETGLIRVAGVSPICGPARLPGIKDGTYSVFYKDSNGATHIIGQFEISEAKKP